jgi:hypothetical protein
VLPAGQPSTPTVGLGPSDWFIGLVSVMAVAPSRKKKKRISELAETTVNQRPPLSTGSIIRKASLLISVKARELANLQLSSRLFSQTTFSWVVLLSLPWPYPVFFHPWFTRLRSLTPPHLQLEL